MYRFSEQKMKMMMKYYKPEKWEIRKDGSIYELFGIKLYKKYVPSSGDLIRRFRGIQQINPARASFFSELYRYEKITRNYELRHIIGMVLFIPAVYFAGKVLVIYDWIFLLLLNLFVNIYPIFLQRHNRIRILSILEKNGKKSPYHNIE